METLPVGQIIMESWSKIKGSKGVIVGGLFTTLFIMFLILSVSGVIASHYKIIDVESFNQKVTAIQSSDHQSIEVTKESKTVKIKEKHKLQNHEISMNQFTSDELPTQVKPSMVILTWLGVLCEYIFFACFISMVYIGVLRAFDKPFKFSTFFRVWKKPLLVLTVAVFILMLNASTFGALLLGMLLISPIHLLPNSMVILICSGVVLTWLILFVILRLKFGLAVIVYENMDAFTALGKSWQITRGHVFKLFLIFIFNCLLMTIMVLPFSVGIAMGSALFSIIGFIVSFLLFIWFVTYYNIAYGVTYRKLIS